MGLVDYSESDSSDNEAPAPPKPVAQTQQNRPSSKKPFQKVVDRSNPGKIVLNLPQPKADGAASTSDEPPAKRARTGGKGGLFSGLNSFLPPPKNANKAVMSSSGAISKPKPGVNLKTSAAPGFSREGEDEEGQSGSGGGGGLNLPPPKSQAAPSIPEEQKAAEDVKLVGKPLMFRPLSVARNPKKKKVPKAAAPVAPSSTNSVISEGQRNGNGQVQSAPQPAPAPKKVSLFSLHTEEPSGPSASSGQDGAYEPLFDSQDTATGSVTGPYGNPDATQQQHTPTAAATKKVINFNMDREYQHNREMQASGEQQIHNPLRSINAEGKSSLKQLVQNAQTQREALEENFAKGKSNRKEASSRYGW
uniref:Mitotic checkpoint regulator, MAD2B-interacting-domain-containing protein n=1 Tax=Bionectria ochroleuca TaxID=29856 RepID=A0A0B7K0J5_BIOOC